MIWSSQAQLPSSLALNGNNLVLSLKTFPSWVLAAAELHVHNWLCAPNVLPDPRRRAALKPHCPSAFHSAWQTLRAIYALIRAMRFLPVICGTWQREDTCLSKCIPGHLIMGSAWVLMKWLVYVLSAHVPNYWSLCTNPCSAGKMGGETGHSCSAQCWQGLAGCQGARVPRVTVAGAVLPHKKQEPSQGSCPPPSPVFGMCLGCMGFTWDGHMLWMNTLSCHCSRVSRTLAPIQRGGSPGQGALLHKCLQYLAFSRSLLLQIKILGMKAIIFTTESGTLQSFRN